MKIIHRLDKKKVEKEVEENTSFLLTNESGSYISFSKNNFTNFQGFYNIITARDELGLYKSVENIYIDKENTELVNYFSHVERFSGSSLEKFYLDYNAFIYELLYYTGSVNILLDFRGMFDFDDKGRIYKIYKEEEFIIIEYHKFKDNNLRELQKQYFLAIKGAKVFELEEKWEKKIYEYDKNRNSRCEFYVYDALKIPAYNKLDLIFAFGESKKSAIARARYVEENKNFIKKNLMKKSESVKYFLKENNKDGNKENNKKDENENNANLKFGGYEKHLLPYASAINSLNNLTFSLTLQNRKANGIIAGIPWFFQFWSRDELISLKALILEKKYNLVKEIIFRYLNNILPNGRLPNRVPGQYLESADAIGWLFKRVYDFISILDEKKSVPSYLNNEELNFIKIKLLSSIQNINKNFIKDGLVYNGKDETWMDTSYNEVRDGARIEIQALHLNMYKLYTYLKRIISESKLEEVVNKERTNEEYKKVEQEMAKRVKELFFNGELLADGYKNNQPDFTIRPNIFLAHYIYPDLLKENDWRKVFKNSLEKIWLDWGGLSTIDKNSPLFCRDHTGERIDSYHRGDSWFFINNLAALCMYKVDKKTFKGHISKIMNASSEEILFKGFIGHHAELSSASQLKSQGCLCQAWSNAFFIELMHEMEKENLMKE